MSSVATAVSRVLLRGRSDIVGAMCPRFPEYLKQPVPDGNAQFPRRMTESEAAQMAGQSGAVMRQLLTECGALLVTPTKVDAAEKFQDLMRSVGLPTVEYYGGVGHRTSRTGAARIYSASDEPPQFTIETHNEKGDTPDGPDVISFWCQVPAQPGNGGETVLVHSDDMLEQLDPAVLRKLEDRRICYWRRLKHERVSGYLSWQSVFRTNDQQAVENYLTQKRFEYHWDTNGGLVYWNVLAPTKRHPVTGRKVWCNSIQSHHSSYYSVHPTFRGAKEQVFNTFYGDQTPIEDEVLQHIREATWSAAIGFQMAQNEVVMLDNHQVQHGRLAFSGQRKLQVALSNAWTSGV